MGPFIEMSSPIIAKLPYGKLVRYYMLHGHINHQICCMLCVYMLILISLVALCITLYHYVWHLLWDFWYADPPGAPGIPEVEEIGNDFVNLSWDKPTDDGGGRITGYIVERKEVCCYRLLGV